MVQNETKKIVSSYGYLLKKMLEVYKMIHVMNDNTEELNVKWAVLYDNL